MGNFKWLDRDIAPQGPNMILCLTAEDLKEVCDTLPDLGVLEWPTRSDARVYHVSAPDREELEIVCVSRWQGRDPIVVAGLLVHEAVRIWQAYKRSIGEDAPGDEQEAYGIQYISQTLMEEFSRRIKGEDLD